MTPAEACHTEPAPLPAPHAPHAPAGLPAPPALPVAQALLALQAQAMDVAANAMFITDAEGRIVWVNRAFTRVTGYTAREALGATPALLKSGRQSAQWYREFWAQIRGGKVWRGRHVNRRKGGELFDVEQTVTPIRDEQGRIAGFISIHEDITERVRDERTLESLAQFDTLTGLPNRSTFLRRVTEALARARRDGHHAAVMLIDLDHFKQVNDTLGHAAGDALLVQVAQRIRAQLRETDLAARLGGDEFAVLVERLERPEQAMEAAARLVATVRAPYALGGHAAHASASLGIAIGPGGDAIPERLLRHADLAMYEAKARGRDRFQFYDAAMDAAARRRQRTEARLRDALGSDDLYLAWQPQFAVGGGAPRAAEALLRWRDAELGDVPPAEFVPLAEQCGLLLSLTDRVLREALAQAAAWKRAGHGLRVAVNLPAVQLEQAGFAGALHARLGAAGLVPADLELEVAESVLDHPGGTVRDNLAQLGGLGIGLAVDDYGGGRSGLERLAAAPLARLSIGAALVRRIGHDTRAEALVRGIAALAHALGLRVLAEGVETAAQEAFLRAAGIGEVQGFRYAAPMAAALLAADAPAAADPAAADPDAARANPARRH